jgi:hypothetical protein
MFILKELEQRLKKILIIQKLFKPLEVWDINFR